MIDLYYNDKPYTIKNDIKEFTLDEFEDIYSILSAKICKYDKCVKIFHRLGLNAELIANLDANDIKKIMDEFNFDMEIKKIKKTIKLNNLSYSCYDKSFKLSVKKMLMIQSYMNVNNKKYFGEVLAILYTNNKCKLSIKEKAKLIREQIPVEVALPIITEITLCMIENIKILIND